MPNDWLTIKEFPLKIGDKVKLMTSLMVVEAIVTTLPESEDKQSLYWKYKHPHKDQWFWREIWPVDQYQVNTIA